MAPRLFVFMCSLFCSRRNGGKWPEGFAVVSGRVRSARVGRSRCGDETVGNQFKPAVPWHPRVRPEEIKGSAPPLSGVHHAHIAKVTGGGIILAEFQLVGNLS